MQTATAQKNAVAQAEPAQHKGGAVAVIAPPRLPYHPQIEERFGVDRAQWRALTDAVFPAAKTTDAIILALSYCKARRLDPFKRVVHIVPVYDSEKRAYVETVWPGIAEHRTTAFRTKAYAGAEAAQFGETITKEFLGEGKNGRVAVTVTFPEWCQLTVYRLIDGQRVPVPGPRVYWLETYSKMGRMLVPNDRWQRAPFQMIEKCAEAAALRRAFPEEIGDEPTAEEVGAYDRGGDEPRDITPPRKPTRADFAESAADREFREAAENGEVRDAVVEVINEETGEVTEVEEKTRDPFWSADSLEIKPAAKGKGTDWKGWRAAIDQRIAEAEAPDELARLDHDNARHVGNYTLADRAAGEDLRATFATRAGELAAPDDDFPGDRPAREVA